MSAASSFMTHSNGYQAAPATNGVFPLADRSPMHESGQVQASFLDTIVGRRGGLRSILAEVEAVAPTNATVLISGETGTGKEVSEARRQLLDNVQAGRVVLAEFPVLRRQPRLISLVTGYIS